jgi:hypothetical protein
MKLLQIATLIFLLTNCSQGYNCEDFKTGTYKFAEPEFSEVTVTRSASEQIETSTKAGEEYRDVYEILWNGTCSYQLVFKSTDNIDRMPFSKFDTISASIIEIVEDGYIYETEIFNQRPRGHFIKVD